MTLSRAHELRLIDYAIENLLGNIPKSTDPSIKIVRSATNVRKVRKGRKHSKAGRAAISRRMKAYWAKRRKQ